MRQPCTHLTSFHISVGDTVVWSWRQEPARRGRAGTLPSLPLTIHLLSRALVPRQSVASPLGCDHFSTLSRAPKCERASKPPCFFSLVLHTLCDHWQRGPPFDDVLSYSSLDVPCRERDLWLVYPQKIMDFRSAMPKALFFPQTLI